MGFVTWFLGPKRFEVADEGQGKMQTSPTAKAETHTLQDHGKS